MKIAFVEDEEESLNKMISIIERYEKENSIRIEWKAFRSGEEFIAAYDSSYDVVFMDIIMNQMNGFETSEKLREIDNDVYLIFTTTVAHLAIEGYKYSAQDYFVKPVSYEKVKMRLDRIKDGPTRSDSFYLEIPLADGVEKIYAKNILYVESEAHMMIFHMEDRTIKVRYQSLQYFEKALSPYGFAKCNMCYLVNLKHCKSIHGSELRIGSDVIQISRAKKTEFLKAFSDFLSVGGRR